MGVRPHRRHPAGAEGKGHQEGGGQESGGQEGGEVAPTDHAKLDAALASALADVPGPDARVLPVFVELAGEPPEAGRSLLAELGVGEPTGNVATATLSAREVGDLSDQPWVRYLRLSGRLRLLDEPPGRIG